MQGRFTHLLDAVCDTVLHLSVRWYRVLSIGMWNGLHESEIINQAHAAGAADVQFFGIGLFEEATTKDVEYVYGRKVKPPTLLDVRNYIRRKTRCRVGEVSVEIFRGRAEKVFKILTGQFPVMNLVLLNGTPSARALIASWHHASGLLAADGVAMIDDYRPGEEGHGSRMVVDRIERRGRFLTEVLEPADIDPVTKEMVHMVRATRRSRSAVIV